MNLLPTIDLLALGLGWACCWKVVRHSLPAQNVLAIAGISLATAAVAHGFLLLFHSQALTGDWHAPAVLGLFAVASRAVARRLDLGFAYTRAWMAFLLTIPLLFSFEPMTPRQGSHKHLLLAWALSAGVCQIVVTPWWIRKTPAPEEHHPGAGLLWMAMSWYVGARAYVAGGLVSGVLTIVAGVAAGWLALRGPEKT